MNVCRYEGIIVCKMILLVIFVVAYAVVDESACLKGLKVCEDSVSRRYGIIHNY